MPDKLDPPAPSLQVVRLKGGCVSLFSRVGDEMRALSDAQIDFELVPGVSSALAAPAIAGMPLTDASVGTSVAFFSSHVPESVPWQRLAPPVIDTVVLLMAGRGFKTTLALATDAGWPEDTPVSSLPWQDSGTKERLQCLCSYFFFFPIRRTFVGCPVAGTANQP